MRLFTKENVVGIFRGMNEGGLEFHADLIFPYKNEFQSTPIHGQFVVVQLESEWEAVLGRITSFLSQGRLVSPAGEDYGIRAVSDDRSIPEDLREQYLRYRVDIRVLGVLRVSDGRLTFVASHRRLPHVGSKVAFLSDEVLREVAGHHLQGGEIGFLAFGEFIYGKGDPRLTPQDWMILREPAVTPRFQVEHLVARRSFVFARAGFGKSNLVKLLFSNLYKTTPKVEKRGGKQVPVGTIIFDPDGEYFWPDDKNRPGLCDVPHLRDQIVVFTKKKAPSPFYGSFVAGDIKIDIRRFRPADVIAIALPQEKQDQQNVRKLKGLNDNDWQLLVDEVYQNGNGADGALIKRLLHLENSQEAEMVAARANMTTIVKMLHDPGSQMLDMLMSALRNGKICVVDVSQMRGTPALVLSGLILRRIFNHNQDEFTQANPQTIPTIAVLEEAQSVLGNTGSSGEGPYIEWVKEGRKYDLGALLITQQPGSIANEILSQGDNWFVFHLLSDGDLRAVKRANAHFSDDLLSSLLNEPIPGHGVFWSSAGGKTYPIPFRGLLFESAYSTLDPRYDRTEVETYAVSLRLQFQAALYKPADDLGYDYEQGHYGLQVEESRIEDIEPPQDIFELSKRSAVEKVKRNYELIERIRANGIPWKGMLMEIAKSLPDNIVGDSERQTIAHQMVPGTMDELFGQGGWTDEKRPRKTGSGRDVTWLVVRGKTEES